MEIESLKCVDVLAIALLMLAVDVVMKLWNTRGTRMTAQELELLKQYNAQVVIVNRLNSVETFVAQSKAIRQMNTIKKQMQELAGTESQLTPCVCYLMICSCQWNACKRPRRPSSRSALIRSERCVELSIALHD